MIVTITPNLALDVTYELAELRPGRAHRVRSVHARAGGKGVNVARMLRSLGHDVLVLGLAGGPTGAVVAALAAGAGSPWPELLRDAVALSAAAVLAPVAGSYDSAAYEGFRTCRSSPQER